MELRTYKAATMHEALQLVRCELGPDAAILHTREVRNRRVFGLLRGPRHIEVTASVDVHVPSRLQPEERFRPDRPARPAPAVPFPPISPTASPTPSHHPPEIPERVQGQLQHLQEMVEQLCRQQQTSPGRDLPEELFRVFTDLIECDIDEDVARELVDRIRREVPRRELAEPMLTSARVARMIEEEIAIAGPIRASAGRQRIVALIGPTGVGKTTTIAKLAANFRLKEKRRVGLITVDTYRIAAVEQLRTYADIIDLPMHVVSTAREMREAIRRMNDLDLVLMDTAGRSPRDEVRIRELKALLDEAGANEVHLVLSGVTGSRTLVQTAERFGPVGPTAMVLTKLDEATSLGNVLPLLRSSRLPLSYLTNGQNVPDDIETADAGRLAGMILGH